MKDFHTTLIKLYYLLINADGNVAETEIQIGKKMVLAEGIDTLYFDDQLKSLEGGNPRAIYREALANLKRIAREQQIRAIAWICLVANADGFMDVQEWKLIYQLYNDDLKLDIKPIIELQKQLHSAHLVRTKS
jgi:uncharacterized tellurite resistance protein B-like protein